MGGLSDISCRYPGIKGFYPEPPREGKTGIRPYQKPEQHRTRIQVLCQEEVISLQSSAQVEALQSDSSVQDGGTRKKIG